MRYSIPVWFKELVDQVNATGGEGMPGLLRNFQLFNRIGCMVDRGSFVSELTSLVEGYETAGRESQTREERLKTLRYPNLLGKNWRAELHAWMQEVMDAFLGFHVDVPEPPALNRNQRRLLKKYGFKLFFVPAILESQYPDHMVKFGWDRFLSGVDFQCLPLPGKWVAFETIQKPNYSVGKYPDDQLMEDIGVESRFNHPHSDKGEGDDLVEDILPKVAKILAPLSGIVRVQSALVFNCMGNLFNWLTKYTVDTLPDLVSTNSVEWCEEHYGSRYALIVGHSGYGGLAYVDYDWRDYRSVDVAFRFLVQF